MRGQDQTSMLI